MQQDINEVEINGVSYVRKGTETPTLNSENAVIVRCQSAGCFFGYLKSKDLKNGLVELLNARRLWYWAGAASLSQLAIDGTSLPISCKFPIAVPSIELTGVIELIPCTAKAVKSINSVVVWKV